MQIQDLIQKRAAYCRARIGKIEELLKSYPPGTLYCYPNGQYYSNFIRYKDEARAYISKKDIAISQQMAQKKLLQAEMQDLKAELTASERYLDSLRVHYTDALQNTLSDKGIQKLLHLHSKEERINEWMQASYPKNPNYPEHLTIPTVTGEKVRSKSEAMIVQLLQNLEIPFHYEQQLILNGRAFYPDFTLLRTKDMKIFIMELFGMMDEPNYAGKTLEKLRFFTANGYIPDVNLLCYYETASSPLNINRIKADLEIYFDIAQK